MNTQLLVTLVIVSVSIAFLVSERLRADLVALLMVLALGFTGVLTPQETFSGLSRSAVGRLLRRSITRTVKRWPPHKPCRRSAGHAGSASRAARSVTCRMGAPESGAPG